MCDYEKTNENAEQKKNNKNCIFESLKMSK